jgi:hypothetical protein
MKAFVFLRKTFSLCCFTEFLLCLSLVPHTISPLAVKSRVMTGKRTATAPVNARRYTATPWVEDHIMPVTVA